MGQVTVKPQLASFFLLLASLLIVPVCLFAQTTTLTARLDRTEIFIGETVNLFIVQQGSTSAMNPDFTVLEDQFNVLDTSTQTQVSITNGQQQSSTQLVVVLEPKQEGQLRIPPIPVGNQQTSALRLSVRPEPEALSPDNGTTGEDIVLEVESEPDSVYVQSQVIVTVRLLMAVAFSDASLTDLTLDNAQVQKLGEDTRYQSQRHGRNYNVIERRYAVFPERSGVLQIPSLQLAGWVGGSARGGLFSSRNRGRRITRNSETLAIEVLPVPDTYRGDHWLPARALQLRELGLEQDKAFRVGEPLTRTIELLALGLPDEMLPDLQPETPDNARVYADKPVGETFQQAGSIASRRSIKQAVVPTVAGMLKLPEVRLAWWDNLNNEQREAVIPASVVEVLPALDDGSTAAPPPTGQALPVPADQLPSTVTTTIIDPGFWPYLSFGFAALWVLTILGWLRARQSGKPHQTIREGVEKQKALNVKAARQACRQACQSNDPHAAAESLIAWAKALSGDASVNNLGQLIGKVDNTLLQRALKNMEKSCYGQPVEPWSGESLWELLKQDLPIGKSVENQYKTTLLPSLYPETR